MLVAKKAVYGEAWLVANAEPAVAEHVEALRLGWQQHLAQPLVPGLEPGDLVDDDLPLDGHAEAVGGAGGGGGAHHPGGKHDAALEEEGWNESGF